MSASLLLCRSGNSAADTVSAALAAEGEPWFPGLAEPLAQMSRGWLAFDSGRAYGTARWLANDPCGPREEIAKIAIAGQTALVELLPAKLGRRFAHVVPAGTVRSGALAILREAADLLEQVPSLAQSVGAVIRTIHVLDAEPGYDVSHSEPTLPFSIFVSVPGVGEKDPVVRVAESIVHEAMHLQLTMMEEALPMVASDEEGYSPWLRRARPARGLLHGLYVFSVIMRFLNLLSRSQPACAAKASLRRTEIKEEVGLLDDFDRHLTEHGKSLRALCLRVVNAVPEK